MSYTENQVIHRGSYQRLEKAELMELPWIRECLASPANAVSMLFFNNCRGWQVMTINDGGAIMGSDPTGSPIYIGRYSEDVKPNRFYILRMSRGDDGFVEPDPCEIIGIRKVTVSANNSGTDVDGPRVFSDGPNVWRYL
jgi:hypothetical protein